MYLLTFKSILVSPTKYVKEKLRETCAKLGTPAPRKLDQAFVFYEKMMKISRYIIVVILLATGLFAQVAAPKHESKLHHLFAPHRDEDNLEQRFSDLRCALVLIQSGNKIGTGFFVSEDGDIATASHVLGDRVFNADSGSLQLDLTMPIDFQITNSTGSAIAVPSGNIVHNDDAWEADVAILKTKMHPPCWLAMGDDKLVRPGQHLIALGFPGLAFGSISIYSGIAAARVKSLIPNGITNKGLPVNTNTEYIRLQMPISGGLSGAPVIDDENRVISIVTNAGAWSGDLDLIIQAWHMNAFAMPPAQNPQTRNFNVFALVAQLADAIHDYGSPGYGDSVPVSYLKKVPPSGHQSTPAAH